jgi:hypothetical protein
VRLEPSGWGTKVTLTADAAEPPEAEPEPEPEPEPAPEPVAKVSWWSRFRRRREPEPVTAPEPEPVAVPAPEPALDPERAQAALTGVLDTLGAAHHRPFSRP